DSSTKHYYFFFQAEDGIRDRTVTGVQTCALPIYTPYGMHSCKLMGWQECIPYGVFFYDKDDAGKATITDPAKLNAMLEKDYKFRSEERRVGKECRVWWDRDH